MNSVPKFCGQCGAPFKSEEIRFCGECGAAVTHIPNQQPPHRVNPQSEPTVKPASSHPNKFNQRDPTATNPPKECDSLLSKNSLVSATQWAVVWLLGWLPIGILFSGFYTSIRTGNPGFYSQYPRTWDTTMPGMLATYGIGSLTGGFIAGLLIYRILNKQNLNIGILGLFPALVWVLLWGGVLGVMTMPLEKFMDDGTLIITIPIFALIFGGVTSRFAVFLLTKKHSFSTTRKAKNFIMFSWAGCSLLGVIVAMLISGV